MCRLVESVKLKDGVFCRLKLHQKRVNKAFEAYFPDEEPISLFDNLYQAMIPQGGIYKCRIVYDANIQLIEILPYVRREIHSLKLVEIELESRAYKLEVRTELNAAFAQRGNCDDVLLIRDGLLTDASYSNIALYDGLNWFTPRVPLLYGVNRADLLEQGKLIEKDISVDELKNYQKITLFNAMIEFGELVLDIDKIEL